jgi:penicillin-binding protein 2
MFDRVISGAYPSGSTIKPLVAAGGLQENVITQNTTIDDSGSIKVGSWVYPDWKAHGLVDIRRALAVSCNVFFYAVGGGWDKIRGLGPAKLQYYYEKFGLGAKTGIDLPGEISGLVPSPDWKEKAQKEMWYLGDTYHMSIGQGDVLTTPLQMVMAISAIANNGELLKPKLVDKISDENGKTIQEFSKEVTRNNFVDKDNLQIVREGMHDCVTQTYGSCHGVLGGVPVDAAAKTGTAQYANNTKTHAWMVSFAPYNNPTFAIAVIVEGGGEGYAAAGPVVKDSLSYYFGQN